MTDWLTDGKRAGCRVAHTQLKSKENLFFTGVFTCGYLKFNFSFYASFNSLQCDIFKDISRNLIQFYSLLTQKYFYQLW